MDSSLFWTVYSNIYIAQYALNIWGEPCTDLSSSVSVQNVLQLLAALDFQLCLNSETSGLCPDGSSLLHSLETPLGSKLEEL